MKYIYKNSEATSIVFFHIVHIENIEFLKNIQNEFFEIIIGNTAI